MTLRSLKGFRSSVGVDFIAATLNLPVLIICKWNSGSDFERRRYNTF